MDHSSDLSLDAKASSFLHSDRFEFVVLLVRQEEREMWSEAFPVRCQSGETAFVYGPFSPVFAPGWG